VNCVACSFCNSKYSNMFIRTVSVILCLLLIEVNGIRRRCVNSGALLPDKILRSPTIVYGESMAKQIDVDTDVELLFNVTFRVDCILKGRGVEENIEITNAGIRMGHTACQWLDPGKFYVVFIEKWGLTDTDYRPLDYQELIVDDMTYELLAKTCHLSHIAPLHGSSTNKCPNVSLTEFCPRDKMDMIQIMPKQRMPEGVQPHMQSPFNDANQFQLQSNVTIPKQGSAVASNNLFGDKSGNRACSSTLALSIMFVAIFIVLVI